MIITRMINNIIASISIEPRINKLERRRMNQISSETPVAEFLGLGSGVPIPSVFRGITIINRSSKMIIM